MQIKNKLKYFYWSIERTCTELYVRLFLKQGVTRISELAMPLTVCLTSYPPRFPKLHLTLRCLLTQDLTPQNVVLWIAHEDKYKLPSSVTNLQNEFSYFSIEFCEDLGSYKKLVPALAPNKYNNDIIVTADDDCFYPKTWLSNLVDNWSGKNDEIIAYRTHAITFNSDNMPTPYSQWRLCVESPKESDELFATGCGGILYPPNSLDANTTNSEVFLALCNNADDIWFYWMAKLNNSKICKVPIRLNMINWSGTDEVGLASSNVDGGQNDDKLKNLIKEYGWPN